MKLMNILEPITAENLKDLRPGEWIWDNKRIRKPAHQQSIWYKPIYEPFGFRQIHDLDLDAFPSFLNTPFMLTRTFSDKACNWEKFEEGRFFKFRWDKLDEIGKG